jgi:phospholipid/cholesterol/gamma-HCH transport system substrate-binding protein
MAVEQFNRVLDRLNQNLASLERTTAGLDAIIGKIDRGEGTLGLLVNDPTLYHRLDSTVTSMNELLIDLKENPVRYFRALRLVDLF